MTTDTEEKDSSIAMEVTNVTLFCTEEGYAREKITEICYDLKNTPVSVRELLQHVLGIEAEKRDAPFIGPNENE